MPQVAGLRQRGARNWVSRFPNRESEAENNRDLEIARPETFRLGLTERKTRRQTTAARLHASDRQATSPIHCNKPDMRRLTQS
jgi:hypothetical protein